MHIYMRTHAHYISLEVTGQAMVSGFYMSVHNTYIHVYICVYVCICTCTHTHTIPLEVWGDRNSMLGDWKSNGVIEVCKCIYM